MGVVTEVPRQQVAQLDVCVRSRPMCLHAFESGPELAGNTISDLIEPLFRRVKRPNRPIFGEVMYRDTLSSHAYQGYQASVGSLN